MWCTLSATHACELCAPHTQEGMSSEEKQTSGNYWLSHDQSKCINSLIHEHTQDTKTKTRSSQEILTGSIDRRLIIRLMIKRMRSGALPMKTRSLTQTSRVASVRTCSCHSRSPCFAQIVVFVRVTQLSSSSRSQHQQ